MSSKRGLRRKFQNKSCTGKITYKNFDHANSSPYKTPGLHPYKCAFCEGWHLGHNPQFNKFESKIAKKSTKKGQEEINTIKKRNRLLNQQRPTALDINRYIDDGGFYYDLFKVD